MAELFWYNTTSILYMLTPHGFYLVPATDILRCSSRNFVYTSSVFPFDNIFVNYSSPSKVTCLLWFERVEPLVNTHPPCGTWGTYLLKKATQQLEAPAHHTLKCVCVILCVWNCIRASSALVVAVCQNRSEL